jgi:hypothetical protein
MEKSGSPVAMEVCAMVCALLVENSGPHNKVLNNISPNTKNFINPPQSHTSWRTAATIAPVTSKFRNVEEPQRQSTNDPVPQQSDEHLKSMCKWGHKGTCTKAVEEKPACLLDKMSLRTTPKHRRNHFR